MGLTPVGATFGVDAGAEGASITQISDVLERALQECLAKGIDAATVKPTIRSTFTGKIKKIEVTIP